MRKFAAVLGIAAALFTTAAVTAGCAPLVATPSGPLVGP